MRRVKKPIDSRPLRMRCVCSPHFDLPFGTSNSFKSLFLAVCISTIIALSEYINLNDFIVTVPLIRVQCFQFNQLPKRSLNAGLCARWYEPSSSEFVACELVLMGPISLALKSVPVEEQPVARTTITPSITVSNTDRLIWLEKAPEQWSVRKQPLLEGQTSFATCRLIFI